MAEVTFESVSKIYPPTGHARSRTSTSDQGRGVHGLRRPFGLRQDDRPAHGRGLEEISEGELRIGDRVVNDVAPRNRDIAMVFQSYALYPHLTVYDNIAFDSGCGRCRSRRSTSA